MILGQRINGPVDSVHVSDGVNEGKTSGVRALAAGRFSEAGSTFTMLGNWTSGQLISLKT
jgi:hypothetical protein